MIRVKTLSFLLLFWILLFCACSETSIHPSLVSSSVSSEEAVSSESSMAHSMDPSQRPVEIWFSGDLRGYTDPCGCAEGQLGGLGRRAHFIESFGKPLLLLENGDLTLKEENLDLLKQELVLKSLHWMKYTAINVGERDLYLGLTPLRNSPIPFISGNFYVNGTRFFPAFKEVETVHHKVAVLGLLGDSLRTEIENINPHYQVLPMESVLQELLKEISAPKVILLLHGIRAEAFKIAEKFPQLEAIIYAHQYEMYQPHETKVVYSTGMYGKGLGRLRFPASGPLEYELTLLDNPDHLKHSKMNEFKNEFYKRYEKEKHLIEPVKNSGLEAISYSGSDSCGKCHPQAYESWKNSLHFKAIPTLIAKKENRNPDCLGCHTVGYGFPSGYHTEQESSAIEKLGAVGCESCHGPGEAHLKDPKKPMKAGEASCLKCHNSETSPKFHFETYWKKIKHE
jgi:hypothetical protein